ncbi:DNA (cytosine-5)-methyltransferase CMT3-like [Papaver somniferum]|uniref:DNA (cytosine-5)-methyltransferase CMT3-like n=1 Tax=Papaver somniferum TaxID=3469 RepID=UPI000E6FFB1A|nr:DNA (cytosine-5)-methyltransferase CMT3-like [Papaver somniferum]
MGFVEAKSQTVGSEVSSKILMESSKRLGTSDSTSSRCVKGKLGLYEAIGVSEMLFEIGSIGSKIAKAKFSAGRGFLEGKTKDELVLSMGPSLEIRAWKTEWEVGRSDAKFKFMQEPNEINQRTLVFLFSLSYVPLDFKSENFPMFQVIKEHSYLIDAKRVFSSDSGDDNPLDCILSKITVAQASKFLMLVCFQVPGSHYYYDMSYCEEVCTFKNLQTASTSSTAVSREGCSIVFEEDTADKVMTLLDISAGCGGMSTGLCMGAAASNVNLVTRWAVDFNEDACESLRHNHPETEVRNMKAKDFLHLLYEWKDLCSRFHLLGTDYNKTKKPTKNKGKEETEEEAQRRPPDENGEYEVERIIGIYYGVNPDTDERTPALHFKVKWKGWGSDWDSWEPYSELTKCEDCIEEFVTDGYQSNILPLPGTVDVVCGGPPCQGISGFNRFRNYEEPLKDPKNYQLVVFMDIVKFLQPKFTLMENVVDLMRFLGGTLGRYAMGRLVAMQYQVRLGLLIAGSYGLPQFRMRTFLWGAKMTEKLPQFPLPTHKVIARGYNPKEFERNVVKGDEAYTLQLKDALVLKDAIFDLPKITTHEIRDERDYGNDIPTTDLTDFQKMIRLPKHKLMGSAYPEESVTLKLFDHRPLKLSEDDNLRVSMIPRVKGANFRNLPGVIVDGNKACRDPNMAKVMIAKSRKPLVPEYAIKFVRGTSKKPFGRLWWDEIVSTVVTRAEPHNKIILHPEQDRVLSIRENTRLQGFPDFYRLFGTVKQRYMQVGNAVAVPVGKALGFSLARVVNNTSDSGQVFELPPSFSR